MSKAPESYLEVQRPPLKDAIQAEGNVTLDRALASLERKDYFTARPRPWNVGLRSQGLGRSTFAVLDRFGDVVAENLSKADAELIVESVNTLQLINGVQKSKS